MVPLCQYQPTITAIFVMKTINIVAAAAVAVIIVIVVVILLIIIIIAVIIIIIIITIIITTTPTTAVVIGLSFHGYQMMYSAMIASHFLYLDQAVVSTQAKISHCFYFRLLHPIMECPIIFGSHLRLYFTIGHLKLFSISFHNLKNLFIYIYCQPHIIRI